ncbi:TCP-1/cpn60 chaperonin family-domain-containing protein [Mycena galericulata]|nr:TCP-1/cpn60 chaperonin family-domain-containing protein [Mycena galericulata]
MYSPSISAFQRSRSSQATEEKAENAASFLICRLLLLLATWSNLPSCDQRWRHHSKAIQLDNAAAKILVNISKVQDDEVGDGTTSVTIHPQTIVEGYRIASLAALKALENVAVDNFSDPNVFRQDLFNIARTTLSSKVLSQDKDYFANLAVDAVLRLKVIKKVGGKLTDSYLDEDHRCQLPKRMENVKILIANTSMDTDKIKIFGARVKVDGTGKLAELERAEREKMKAKVDAIAAHGINCFVNRQLIYNYPESLLAEKGIMTIEHADFEGVERLSLVTGGEIASTFDRPDLVNLGHCELIEEIMIGEDKLIKFSGVAAGEACTVVLRGSTNQMVDEAERSLHDALSVLSQTVKETRTVLGGGCSEMLMSCAVDEEARKVKGKKAIACEAFGRALRQIPTILADNAGYDSSDLVSRLRAAHYEGQPDAGLDMDLGTIGSMKKLGITESYKLKRQIVLSASEAAEMIIRVDDILRQPHGDERRSELEHNRGGAFFCIQRPITSIASRTCILSAIMHGTLRVLGARVHQPLIKFPESARGHRPHLTRILPPRPSSKSVSLTQRRLFA